MSRPWLAALVYAPLALGCGDGPAPFGEAIVVVDTDTAVPAAANRLRLDFYREDGGWFASQEVGRPDAADWPVSFSVFNDDESAPRSFYLRLRLYPEGHERDYFGERFQDWGGSFAPLPGTGLPRLIIAGVDATPALEPSPLVTIDRLIHLRLVPGEVGQVNVTLRAACVGTMAMLPGSGSSPASCVAVEQQRELVATAPLTERVAIASEVNALAPLPCAGEPERPCIPGGAMILGTQVQLLVPDLPVAPTRGVILGDFLLDRQEVTVARYRAALAAGFAPPDPPVVNDGLFTSMPDDSSCSFSSEDEGRESYALSCVSHTTARAFCQFHGGDLPTEAQWERAATLAQPRGQSRYPWGDEPPTCGRAVYGRLSLGTPGVCVQFGLGPQPVDVAPADVTVQGVNALGGGVHEWVLGAADAYDGAGWGSASVTEPLCEIAGSSTGVIRGGSWASPPTFLPSVVRSAVNQGGEASFIGFRCAYPAAGPGEVSP